MSRRPAHSHALSRDLTRHLMLALAGVALLAGATWPVPVSARPVASVRIEGPAAVRLGQPIRLRLSVRDSVDLAGYETALLFDTGAAHFGGVSHRRNDLRRLGRDVMALGHEDIPGGVTFGLYSCPAGDCVSRNQPRGGVGRRAAIDLARIAIVPERAGMLELRFAGARFVDSDGHRIAVTGADGVVRIRVDGAARPVHRAPRLPWDTDRRATGRAIAAADLTGDGIVTHADAMSGVDAWTMARLAGDPCGRVDRSVDLDGDGCIDVADLQRLAAGYSRAGAPARWAPRAPDAGRAPRSTAAALPQATQPTSGVTFVVNSTSDAVDSNPGNGICRTSGNVCSLRAAIEEANRTQGGATVAFSIPGSGTHTINIGSRLPIINNESGPVFVDGYTEPGASPNTHATASNAVIRIEVRGTGESNRFPAFRITSADNTIRGLAIFRVWRAFVIDGPGAHDNAIVGDFIGTDAAGTYNTSSWVRTSNGALVLDNEAHHNQIGRPVLADRNVVSGGPASGVYHTHYAHHNLVQNNIIGLNPAGTARLPNKLEGVDYNFGASDNLDGGTGPLERNVQSGNNGAGGETSHGLDTMRNRFVGNYIGTDLTGTRVLSHTRNGAYGIRVEDGSKETEVTDNVIAGNGGPGIRVDGVGTHDTLVARNRVGITLDGTAGGNATGIRVNFHALRGLITQNEVANNPRGVEVRDVENDGFTISRNSIHTNTASNGLGIDLRPVPGVNLNDAGDGDSGANEQLNFPVLGTASPSVVTGTACAGCTVEVFESDRGPGLYGSGRTFIGSAVAAGNGAFSAAVSGIEPTDAVTATATDAAGNTSEFSLNVAVGLADVFASDAFTRTLVDSWGSADAGGGYTLAGGPAADFDVSGSAGVMRLPVNGANRAAHLLGVSAQDVDVTLRVQLDRLPTAGSLWAYAAVRRISGNNEYRVSVRVAPSGQVYLRLTRALSGAETGLAAEAMVPGLIVSAGSWVRVRLLVTGTSPTSISARAWADGPAEPGSWITTAVDTTAQLQGPGAVSVRAYAGNSVTNAPITVSFDDYRVTAP